MKQHVRFCTAADGVRLAYAVHGSGSPAYPDAKHHLLVLKGKQDPVDAHWIPP